MDKIRTGLAAYGMSGRVFHAPFISTNPHFELTAVTERSKELSREKYPDACIVRSFEELIGLEGLDLVVINTPDSTHYEYARRALEAGKHVVVEKPFTTTVAEAEELVALAASRGLTLSVYQNRRWDCDFLTVKQILSKGLLGHLVEFESTFPRYRNFIKPNTWKETGQDGGGLTYNLGAHVIDQAVQLFGMPEAVFADIATLRKDSKVDDYFIIHLLRPSKAPEVKITLKSSYLMCASEPRFVLHGRWKIQCKLPPKTRRFCPLKTFNNAPLKSLDRWGYYYFSLFPSVCSHFTDTFSCQLNPVRRMYNTIHNGICYCRVSDCIIPIVRWQLRGDDDGLAPMSVLYYIEQDGSFLGIKVHKEEVIQYEQRAPFDSLEFRFQCAFYFCHLKRTHKFRSIRIICPYALLAGFIPHCCGKEALPGTG